MPIVLLYTKHPHTHWMFFIPKKFFLTIVSQYVVNIIIMLMITGSDASFFLVKYFFFHLHSNVIYIDWLINGKTYHFIYIHPQTHNTGLETNKHLKKNKVNIKRPSKKNYKIMPQVFFCRCSSHSLISINLRSKWYMCVWCI